MYALLLIATLGMMPEPPVAIDTADAIEVNHYFDENGRVVFDQVIFWEWCGHAGRHHVFAWRLLKEPAQVPLRDTDRGGYVSIWYDGDILRKVRARSSRETWTQYDPELIDRQLLPQHYRRGLIGAKAYKIVPRPPHDHEP